MSTYNLYRSYLRIYINAVVTNRMKIYRIFYCFIFTRKKKDAGFSPFPVFGITVNLIVNTAPRANIKTGAFLRLFSAIDNLHTHIIAKLAAQPLHCFYPIATKRCTAFYLTQQRILSGLQHNINFITVGIAIILGSYYYSSFLLISRRV